MQQQLRALDVSQKAIAQTRARVRAFNQSRYIGNDEGVKVSQVHDAEMRFQSRERIISNLWARCRNGRDKRRLAGIWKTHQAHIRKQLQLELKVQLFSTAAALVIARSTIG